MTDASAPTRLCAEYRLPLRPVFCPKLTNQQAAALYLCNCTAQLLVSCPMFTLTIRTPT